MKLNIFCKNSIRINGFALLFSSVSIEWRLNLFIYWLIKLSLAAFLYSCTKPQEHSRDHSSDTNAWLNHNAEVKFVGSEKCEGCHQEIYNDWKLSSKGRSFGDVDLIGGPQYNEKIEVTDPEKSLTYSISGTARSGLSVVEKTGPSDTGLKVPISFGIGSGRQTRSYLYQINGYFYEHPITWYSRKNRWDLSPGFERGQNSRFDRLVGSECMQCHNDGTQVPDPFANQRFLKIGGAIGCESCHGPGSLHIKERKNEKPTAIDRTIVNPKHLPVQLQTDVCRNCHLEGVTVERKAEPFLPGKKLSDHTAVFIPIKGQNKEAFGFASHAERLQLSKCYTLSKEQLTCTNCHNPHKPASESVLIYNAACKSCHINEGAKKACKSPNHEALSVKQGCVSCHMYKGPSTDIPHTSSRDHFIRIIKTGNKPVQADGPVTDLKDFTSGKTQPKEYALALMKWFESFEAEPKWLKKAETEVGSLSLEQQVVWHFLAGKPLTGNLLNLQNKDFSSSLNMVRYARQLISQGKKADVWYNYAVEKSPNDLNIRLLKGDYHLQSFQTDSAIKEYKAILTLQPEHWQASGHLAAALLQQKDYQSALGYAQKSVRLNPLYKQGWEYYKVALAQSGQVLKAASIKVPKQAH